MPTRRKDALAALRLMNLPKGATVVDMGAGDGVVLVVAAEQGYRTVGIELNPLLVLIARLRTRKFGGRVRVIRGNMWRWHLPPETTGVFLFTAGPFAGRTGKWLRTEQAALGRPLAVVSLGFDLPGERAVRRSGASSAYLIT